MKRRDVIAGMTMAGVRVEGQQQEIETLYIPRSQRVEDRKFLHDFMDEFAFADLVTASPAPRITHVPMLLDRTAGPHGTLYGHVARKNPQTEAFDGRQTAVAVFHGPHAYIPASWSGRSEAVPTWNFAVVHASGKPKALTDPKAVHDLLERLVRKFARFEEGEYGLGKLPDKFKYGLIAGVTGFEMEIERIEGKFKMGQERDDAARRVLLERLRSVKPERSIQEFTAAFFVRK